MVICVVCGSEEFDEQDGLYFCQTCLTQSQDFRREEEAEDVTSFNIQTRLKKKTQKDGLNKKDKGRPWHTYEAFTIIIREQVKALIKLGSSPKLKNVVLQLWCNFLSKTGVAFPEEEKILTNCMQGYVRQREKYPGSLKHPEILPKRKMKTMEKKYGASSGTAKKDLEEKILSSNLQDEEFYEGDDPTQPAGNEKMSADSSDEEEIDRNLLKELREQAEWMNMPKTLCFCYIGSLYTDNLLSVCDIIRWASESQIPYYEATKLLPDDMKFNTGDSCTFVTNILTHEHIVNETDRLIQFLGLTDIPKVPLHTITSKFIVMLDLPGEMHGFIYNLIQSDEKTDNRKYQELLAIAYIITLLQMLFGLDDSSERVISNIAVELNQIPNNRYNMFVWSDWTSHINQKIKIKGYCHFPHDPRDIKDTKHFLQSFPLGGNDKKYSETRYQKDRTLRQETQDALIRPLESLQSRLLTNCTVEEDDDEYNPFLEQTLADNLTPSTQNKTDNEINMASEKYRSSSLKFLTQPDIFQKELNSSSQVSVIEDSEEENISDIDLFESPCKRVKQKSEGNTAKDKQESTSLELRNKLSSLEKNKLYAKIDKREKFDNPLLQSRSYQWLINIGSSLLNCSVASLCNEVGTLQNCLFTNWDGNYASIKLVSLYKR